MVGTELRDENETSMVLVLHSAYSLDNQRPSLWAVAMR